MEEPIPPNSRVLVKPQATISTGVAGPARVRSEPTSRQNGMAPRVINEILHQVNLREREGAEYAVLASKKLSSDPYHIQMM